MVVSRVIGHATSTVRHPSLRGVRLLLCEALDAAGKGTGAVTVAGDWLGAGKGDTVLVTSDGDAANVHTGDPKTPLRSVVIEIIDPPESERVAS